MHFDELSDTQFEQMLHHAMRARPEPAAPVNLAGRAITLARHAPAAASVELARSFRWKRWASIAAAILVVLVVCAGVMQTEHNQSTSGNLATWSNLGALWSSGSTTSGDSTVAENSDASTSNLPGTSENLPGTSGNANLSDSASASDSANASGNAENSGATDGSLSSMLDSSGTEGWMLLGGAAAIGAIVLLMTARALAADDTSLAATDSMFV